jgi:hypothetical protein
VDTHDASAVVVPTLFIKNSEFAASASERWHTAVNFLALQRQAGKTFIRVTPTTSKV